MHNLLAKVIDSSLVRTALKVSVAQVLPSTNPFFDTQYFQHACATPLTTLLLETQQLSGCCTSKKDLLARHQRLQFSAQQLKELFLQCSTSGTSEVFSLECVIQSLQKRTMHLLETKVHFVTQTTPNIEIKGQKLLLIEALFCLIKNAGESYNDESEKIAIVRTRKVKNSIEIEVRDFGTGMNTLTLLLSQVRGVSFKKCGTGLGVSFAKRVVKECFFGNIKIESKTSHGTTVRLRVPIHLPDTHILG